MTDRDTLERVALETVSPDNYYDLADNLDITTDEELRQIIAANGVAEVELANVEK